MAQQRFCHATWCAIRRGACNLLLVCHLCFINFSFSMQPADVCELFCTVVMPSGMSWMVDHQLEFPCKSCSNMGSRGSRCYTACSLGSVNMHVSNSRSVTRGYCVWYCLPKLLGHFLQGSPELLALLLALSAHYFKVLPELHPNEL